MAMVYQKGTVYLKGTREKKWYGKFRVYLQDQDGKESEKTRKVVLGPKAKMRKFEAEARLQEIIRQSNGGMLEGGTELAFDDSVTFDWFVENRYFPMREGRWRPATKKTTEFEIRRYLVSALGSKPMRTLNTFELQVVLNKLAQTYSDSRARPPWAARSRLGEIRDQAMGRRTRTGVTFSCLNPLRAFMGQPALAKSRALSTKSTRICIAWELSMNSRRSWSSDTLAITRITS